MFERSDSALASNSIPATAGIGLRFQHHREVAEQKPGIDWMEVHSENYMGGGAALGYLAAIRRDYPISLHGVGLSLGTAEGIDARHLTRLAELVQRIEPGLISEHVAWSVSDGTYLADLLPLPMTEEALDVVCRGVSTMQDGIRRQVLVENPSSYLRYRHSTIPEWEFMAAIAHRTGCGILCDVNNIVVSASNHGFDARDYVNNLPARGIGEIHVAGHSIRELGGGRSIRIDDHASRVSGEVWDLLGHAIARFGAVPTLIEWDNEIPGLSTLLDEAAKARAVIAHAKEMSVAETV